ncbi:MAG TPA: ATP synthase subunit I [Byssovorax sp.]|jgi:hypothetical protein
MALGWFAFAFGGVLAAAAYRAALALNVRLYLGPRAHLGPLVHVGRTAALALVFVGLARAGAAPLLAAMAGFVVAHAAVLVAARRVG